MNKILSGKEVAKSIQEKIISELEFLKLKPRMVILQVGVDASSSYYAQNIIRQGTKLGCEILYQQLPQNTTHSELEQVIRRFNQDKQIHGIMIQKPLPGHIDDYKINLLVLPEKDIDGINPQNLGNIFMDKPAFVPCTAEAVIELLKYYEIKTAGKHVVVLGRSVVVGKPLIGLLLQKNDFGNATTTVCHSKTPNLIHLTGTADILVAAIGKPLYVTADMIKPRCVCVDVGINEIQDSQKGKIFVGDIAYEECLDKAAAITPVPGGIGSITTSLLIRNLIRATKCFSRQEKH